MGAGKQIHRPLNKEEDGHNHMRPDKERRALQMIILSLL